MSFQKISKLGFQIYSRRKALQEAKSTLPLVKSLGLKTYGEEESGFCRYNPQINAYAAESPENLAEVLIFVVATQQVRWPDVVAKFPNLMNHLYTNNGLFKKGETRSEEGFPKSFSSVIIGKTDAIDAMWKNRDSIYATLMPVIKEYNNSKSAQKEDAAFKLYLQLLRMPRLGLPKAGFAAQLIIGRFGCIDSINSNILELPKAIVGPDNKFKSPSKTAPKDSEFIGDLTKSGVEMAKKYADYLSHLEKIAGDDISKILWDNWCDIVAHKIKNPRSQFDVELQGGLKGGRVESDYPRVYDPSNPSSEFMKKYASDITGQEVSKQHHPTNLRAALKERRNKVALALKKKFVKETSVAANVGGYSGKADAYPAKPFDPYDLEEASTMAGGNVAGGPTKKAFVNTDSMREPHHKLVGTPLSGRVLEKKKVRMRLKETEMNPATDPRYPVAHGAGLARGGFGATGLENEEEQLSEGLKYHIDNNISLCENIYRPYSNKYLSTVREARKLYKEGKLSVKGLDKWLLESTDVGEYGVFEGKKVALDMPFEEYMEPAIFEEEKKPSKPLNQPFRSSGPKKYAVYVRSKSGGVKKVNFGDVKGGLKSKITDPAARKSFVARHKCTQTHDKTTAGYWACRLPRYAERLGLAKVGAAWW
jgi:hypothetical protein